MTCQTKMCFIECQYSTNHSCTVLHKTNRIPQIETFFELQCCTVISKKSINGCVHTLEVNGPTFNTHDIKLPEKVFVYRLRHMMLSHLSKIGNGNF